jgi:hypothetical protein
LGDTKEWAVDRKPVCTIKKDLLSSKAHAKQAGKFVELFWVARL